MSLNDSLANALEQIAKYDSLGRSEVLIKPKSKKKDMLADMKKLKIIKVDT